MDKSSKLQVCLLGAAVAMAILFFAAFGLLLSVFFLFGEKI